MSILKERFGYIAGKEKTYEEIGNKIGITRERVRQIIEKEFRLIKYGPRRKFLESILENLERMLLQYGGVISINELIKDEYFSSGTRNQIKFLINLINDLYEEQYRVIFENFLTNLDKDTIDQLLSRIQEAAIRCTFPIEEQKFIKNLTITLGMISEDFLCYHLFYNERIEVSNGVVVSLGSKLSIAQRIKLIMKDINRPLHYTEIAKLYKDRFGNRKDHVNLEHNINARLGSSKGFLIVDRGTFILREKFINPDNVKEIVRVSKEILGSLGGNISDTKFLLKELKRRNVNIGELNEYSLKPILLNFPDFIGYRKFEIGLKELSNAERKSLEDLIYDVFSSAKKELHVKEIWRRMSKQRGFPEYAIAQKLIDETKFIKVAPATYTIEENIDTYIEKKGKIVEFATEWAQSKKRPISAFLVKEILSERSEDRNLSLGIVEHVLSTNQKFKKIKKGFYEFVS